MSVSEKDINDVYLGLHKRIAELEASCANHCVCKINDDGAVISLCAEHEHLRQEAVRAEREACAQLCDDAPPGEYPANVAKAIRARAA